MKTLKNLFAAFLFTFAAFSSAPALAQTGTVVTGPVEYFTVTGDSNYGFRVMLAGVSGNYCSGGAAWAYMNEADSNFKVYVAAFMLAKATGATVSMYSSLSGGYCKINYMSMN